MHRFFRGTVIAAALTMVAAPVSAQVRFDAPLFGQGCFCGNRGGFGQIMQVTTTTNVTGLGFRLNVSDQFPGLQNFTAYIATTAAPTTRLIQQSFSRQLSGNPQNIQSLLFLSDPLSFQLIAGTDYLLGFYATGGPASYGWTGSETVVSQNGLTHAGVRELDANGNIVARQFEFLWQLSIQIQGTPVVAAPPSSPPVNVVPEPSTYALMAAGLAVLAAFRRRRALTAA